MYKIMDFIGTLSRIHLTCLQLLTSSAPVNPVFTKPGIASLHLTWDPDV